MKDIPEAHCVHYIRYLRFFYEVEQSNTIRVITKLPNSSKGKVKTHKYINRQNQPPTGKL